MVNLEKLISKTDKEIANIEVSGGKLLKGSIIDFSSEIVVLFNGNDYLYIPVDHVKHLTVSSDEEDTISKPLEPPGIKNNSPNDILTLKTVLNRAQGMYVEMYITGKVFLQGYISNIMADYIIFESPIYKTMYIALKHIKWIIPYSSNQHPYGLTKEDFPIDQYSIQLPQTIENLVKKIKDELVIINLGEKNHQSGKIVSISGQFVEVLTTRSVPYFININHIQTLSLI